MGWTGRAPGAVVVAALVVGAVAAGAGGAFAAPAKPVEPAAVKPAAAPATVAARPGLQKPVSQKKVNAEVGPLVPAVMRVPRPGDIPSGPFADASRVLVTRDGWKVTVTKFGEKLDSVPPLDRSPQSYEGFSSLGGQAKIVAADPKHAPVAKIRSATLTTGVHVGCAVTADSLTVGGSVSNATTGSVTPSVSATGSVTGQGQGGSGGGQGGGSVTGSVTPSVSGSLSDTVTETGNISGVLKPGTTKEIPYAKKAIVGPDAEVMTRDVRLAVDNCIGGVAVRAFVTVAISTDRTDDTVTTFGKPIPLIRP